MLYLLHIGKTGGTVVKAVIKEGQARGEASNVVALSHKDTLQSVLSEHPDGEVAFFVRDPIKRFVSGFNSRMRKGQPRYNSAWTPAEKIAFTQFTTPDSVGCALASDNDEERGQAISAMQAISHARRGLAFALGSVEALEAAKGSIAFIGEQETMEDDIQRFKTLTGISPDIDIPRDDIGAHRTPTDMSTDLSPEAISALREWYADDYRVYDWCLARKANLIAPSSAHSCCTAGSCRLYAGSEASSGSGSA